MMLAELTGLETGSLIVGFVFGAIGLALTGISVFGKAQVRVEQPVAITLTEELHKSFAAREVFEKHVEDNRRDHENIFSKIGGVDRGSGAKISTEVTAIHARINLLDKSNSRLEATTEMQNQTLSQITADVKRILERMPRNER